MFLKDSHKQMNITKSLIVLFILLIASSISMAIEDNLVYSFTIVNNNETLTSSNITLIEGGVPNYFFENSDYTLKIISFNGTELFTLNFKFDFLRYSALNPNWFDDSGKQIYFPSEEEKIDTISSISLAIPYFSSAKKITIFRGEELKLEIDISAFSTCNENNICDTKETRKLCPGECLCGNEKCDTEETYHICSQDCPYNPDLREGTSFWSRILEFIKGIFF